MKKIGILVIAMLVIAFAIPTTNAPAAEVNNNDNEKFISDLLDGQSDEITVTEIGIIKNPEDIKWGWYENTSTGQITDIGLNTPTDDDLPNITTEILYQGGSPSNHLIKTVETGCTDWNYRVMYKDYAADDIKYACFTGLGITSNYGGYIGNGGRVYAVCPGNAEGRIRYGLDPEIWSVWRKATQSTNWPNGGGCGYFDVLVPLYYVQIAAQW